MRDFRVSQRDTETEQVGNDSRFWGLNLYTRRPARLFMESDRTARNWRKMEKKGSYKNKKKMGEKRRKKKRSGRCGEGRGEGRRTGEVCSAGGLGEENHRKDRGREGE